MPILTNKTQTSLCKDTETVIISVLWGRNEFETLKFTHIIDDVKG